MQPQTKVPAAAHPLCSLQKALQWEELGVHPPRAGDHSLMCHREQAGGGGHKAFTPHIFVHKFKSQVLVAVFDTIAETAFCLREVISCQLQRQKLNESSNPISLKDLFQHTGYFCFQIWIMKTTRLKDVCSFNSNSCQSDRVQQNSAATGSLSKQVDFYSVFHSNSINLCNLSD